MTTAELIRRGACQFASRTAVLFADERLTFGEVDELANRIAHVLRARRLDRVAILAENGLYSLPLDFACVRANVARVPLNPRLSVGEMEEMLRGMDVRLLVHTPAQAERATELVVRTGVEALSEPALLELARDAPADDPAVEIVADDTVLLIYTSGTSGRLKAVRHTQAGYAAIVANVLANMGPPERDDVMLHAAPLIHASGTFVIPFWLHGAASAVLPGFVPAEFLGAISRFGATHTHLVPTMLGALLATPGIEDADVSTLRTIVYGASPMPRPVMERALALWGKRFLQYFGQTEAPVFITCLRPEDHEGERLISCGQPSVDCEVRLDPETCEILVRAPFGAAGYVGDDELHRETFGDDGWIRTRDVGRFDDDGFLYLVDRTSDMIVSGGYNVYPREVEDVLAAHPAVRECCVVGAPDATWVEAVTAFVVADGVGGDQLIEHCRARLAGYKVPKSVRFVDEIPKSPVGKLLRRALREPLWERE